MYLSTQVISQSPITLPHTLPEGDCGNGPQVGYWHSLRVCAAENGVKLNPGSHTTLNALHPAAHAAEWQYTRLRQPPRPPALGSRLAGLGRRTLGPDEPADQGSQGRPRSAGPHPAPPPLSPLGREAASSSGCPTRPKACRRRSASAPTYHKSEGAKYYIILYYIILYYIILYYIILYYVALYQQLGTRECGRRRR
jgi:hypothetical protein